MDYGLWLGVANRTDRQDAQTSLIKECSDFYARVATGKEGLLMSSSFLTIRWYASFNLNSPFVE